jgi:predicted TIM-barrel fold metal-dependent hydrolase
MTDPRKATSDITFTNCSVTAEQAGAQGGDRRRQTVIKGRHIKTIDIHAHCQIDATVRMMGDRHAFMSLDVVPLDRLRQMDEQGIDMEALSINPFWYKAERDLADEIVKIHNEKLSELCAAYPDRFVAFASVALQYPDLAVQQLEHAVKRLGLRGAAVGASVAGVEFSDRRFHPFWAKAEELDILIFIHPRDGARPGRRFEGNGWLDNTIGNPLDTTIALSHLIFEGTLDRFPGLKICSAHGGGYLPSYAARSDHACRVNPQACDSSIKLKKSPSAYLKDMYYDTLVFTPEALRHLVAEVGASQLMIGTDHPIGWTHTPVDHVLNTPGLSDDERSAILGDTAARLLKIR